MFGDRVAVTDTQGPRVFHHLESSGRKNVAVMNGIVAVVWEDNRDGAPSVFVALKRKSAAAFEKEFAVSEGGPAYEPVIVSGAGEDFLVGWEQGERVWFRTVGLSGLGSAVQIGHSPSAQITLASGSTGDVHAAWSQKQGAASQIMYTRINAAHLISGTNIETPQPVDASNKPSAKQMFPALAATEAGAVVIAWEDRRHGHTRLYHARKLPNSGFLPPHQLNEHLSMPNATYGRGTGAMRVVLASLGEGEVAAAWLDKRDFTSGYDVYSDFSLDAGANFGPDQKVQDEFADAVAQWHAAIAAHPSGMSVVAWDDDRDDTEDIWLSWNAGAGWSDDYAVPPAAGGGAENNPSIALDDEGDLHLVWVEQAERGGSSRLWYVLGRKRPDLME